MARWDPEKAEVVVYLVLDQDRASSASGFNKWLQQNMTRWILPGRYAVVDDLPTRTDGYPDRDAVADLPCRWLDDDAERTRPRTRRERKLVSIWEGLLGKDDIEIHDNFFLVGGSRALGVEMIERAKVAGIHLAPQTLVWSPTIFELAGSAGDGHRQSKGGTQGRSRLVFWKRHAERPTG
jgi:hypothetical protein